jgi:hypothetical protein
MQGLFDNQRRGCPDHEILSDVKSVQVESPLVRVRGAEAAENAPAPGIRDLKEGKL